MSLMKQVEMILFLWDGSCIVHETFSEKKIVQLKVQHPEAEILAHPECEIPVLRHADYIGSTTALLKYSERSKHNTFIIATEPGIIHQMVKNTPEKNFYSCTTRKIIVLVMNVPYMRLNTLEKLYLALKNKTPEINIPEDTRVKALRTNSKNVGHVLGGVIN